jgi:putative ABC transport system permease protein
LRVSSIASLFAGVQTLRANPLRTVLSTLGVIIGVAALVAILALGDGLERFTREQIESTTDLQTITVMASPVELRDGVLVRRDAIATLTADDARALEADLAGRARTTLHLTGSALARVPGDTATHAVLVEATSGAWLPTGQPGIEAGRWLDAPGERDSAVTVLSHRLAAALAGSAPAKLVGTRLLLGGEAFTVIGVMRAPEEEERVSRAWVPASAASTGLLSGPGRRPPTILVRAGRVEDVDRVQADVEAWLRQRYGSADAFLVNSERRRVEEVSRGIHVFKLAMGSITGISILVGGIGIMNILLASVNERTREIGVRRAAGARRGDIFLQFLAESIAISALGSLIGAVLGLSGAFGITAMIRTVADAPVRAAFDWATVLVAALVAILVGIAFGTYPARYAARLSPIDAIRHE